MDEEMMFEMSAGSLEGLPSVGEMFDLTGKVAVVSGTIGLALSVIYRLASCGADLWHGGYCSPGRSGIFRPRVCGYQGVRIRPHR